MKRFSTILNNGAPHAQRQLKRLRYVSEERVLENEEATREPQVTAQENDSPTAHLKILKDIDPQDMDIPVETTESYKLSKIVRQLFSQAFASRLSFPFTSYPQKTQVEETKEKVDFHYREKNDLYKALQKSYRNSMLSKFPFNEKDWREAWLLYVSPLGIYKLSLQNFNMGQEDVNVMMSLIGSYNKGDIINSTIFLQNLIGNPKYFCFFKKAISSKCFKREEFHYERPVPFPSMESSHISF